MQRLAVLILLFCLSAVARGEAQSPPVNEQPMYGGVEKTAAMKQADAAFLEKVAAMGYTCEQGARKSVELGWKYFFGGDTATAMARFNQAWLQDPENSEVYHGFAVVTFARGEPPEEAERYFRLAISKPGVGATVFVDYARLLNLLGRHDEAIAQGENALAVSPTAENARLQISYAYMAKADAAKACEWGRRAKDNGDRIGAPNYLEMACGAAPH